jgi:hypothetical protein
MVKFLEWLVSHEAANLGRFLMGISSVWIALILHKYLRGYHD